MGATLYASSLLGIDIGSAREKIEYGHLQERFGRRKHMSRLPSALRWRA